MSPVTKQLRADAQRNRDRLLDTAARAFATTGPDVPLETIAKDAGVGIGTLYRHFPTREALVEAVYRNELARQCEAGSELLRELPPDAALRAWMDRFVSYMATKRGLADALRAIVGTDGNPFAESRARLLTGLGTLLDAGAAAGTVRGDVAPEDVLVSLSGLTLVATEPEQAARLLDLLMDGLRVRER
ncbi:TetR/AcrR family transcriptional regulator [Pseudonocardia sp. CA-107938]|uniref:TetR/AcrR family transcriptional regulator n=1 Tax=Pseudonocardia sp. CA-107938 TaxID=3240021 RepID=UPI003D8FCDED